MTLTLDQRPICRGFLLPQDVNAKGMRLITPHFKTIGLKQAVTQDMQEDGPWITVGYVIDHSLFRES